MAIRYAPSRADLPLAEVLEDDERPCRVLAIDRASGVLVERPGGVARRRAAEWLIMTDRAVHAVHYRPPGRLLPRWERRERFSVARDALTDAVARRPTGLIDDALLATHSGHTYRMCLRADDRSFYCDPEDPAAAADFVATLDPDGPD